MKKIRLQYLCALFVTSLIIISCGCSVFLPAAKNTNDRRMEYVVINMLNFYETMDNYGDEYSAAFNLQTSPTAQKFMGSSYALEAGSQLLATMFDLAVDTAQKKMEIEASYHTASYEGNLVQQSFYNVKVAKTNVVENKLKEDVETVVDNILDSVKAKLQVKLKNELDKQKKTPENQKITAVVQCAKDYIKGLDAKTIDKEVENIFNGSGNKKYIVIKIGLDSIEKPTLDFVQKKVIKIIKGIKDNGLDPQELKEQVKNTFFQEDIFVIAIKKYVKKVKEEKIKEIVDDAVRSTDVKALKAKVKEAFSDIIQDVKIDNIKIIAQDAAKKASGQSYNNVQKEVGEAIDETIENIETESTATTKTYEIKYYGFEIVRYSKEHPWESGTPSSKMVFGILPIKEKGIFLIAPLYYEVSSFKAKVLGSPWWCWAPPFWYQHEWWREDPQMNITADLTLEGAMVKNNAITTQTLCEASVTLPPVALNKSYDGFIMRARKTFPKPVPEKEKSDTEKEKPVLKKIYFLSKPFAWGGYPGEWSAESTSKSLTYTKSNLGIFSLKVVVTETDEDETPNLVEQASTTMENNQEDLKEVIVNIKNYVGDDD